MKRSHKLGYLIRSILAQGQPRQCSCCGSKEAQLLDRKVLCTALLRCSRCGLNYRWPRDSEQWQRRFYQRDYSTDQLLMSEMPSVEKVKDLKDRNFPDQPDYSSYLNALSRPGARVLDYGCSWGYNVFKLLNSGFRAEGFELSQPRAQFGRDNLDVTIHTDHGSVNSGFDVVFSSHVIEHLYSIPDFVAFSRSVLTSEGWLITLCPNGSPEFRQRLPDEWHVNWGLLHPSFLDVDFVAGLYARNPYLILTGDWQFSADSIRCWDGRSQCIGERRDGKELLVISRPNIQVV
jgi:SAM-dependent methyltransferase